MPGVCLFNYFPETTSFSFCWSDDQPFTSDTITRVIFRKPKCTFEDPRWARHPASSLWPPIFFASSSHRTEPPSSLPSNIRFLRGPKMSAHFMLCIFARTFLFLPSSLQAPTLFIWSKSLSSISSFPPLHWPCTFFCIPIFAFTSGPRNPWG